MGADGYKIHGGTPNQALFGLGDAVVVDVIRWIGKHYLLPTLALASTGATSTAENYTNRDRGSYVHDSAAERVS